MAKHCRKPFLATHSNARGAASEAARNLTDEMIRTPGRQGRNPGSELLRQLCAQRLEARTAGSYYGRADPADPVHCQYRREECLGLGSDFDGIEEAPEMENAGGMQKLAEAMEGAGISHSLTEKIFWKNADRFLRENLR